VRPNVARAPPRLLNGPTLSGMEKAPEHHVYFAVFGFGDDPAIVTRAMGVEPTKAWVKGEPTGVRKGMQTHSRWALQSTLPLAEPIEAHFENLLPQLECRREAVADVRARFQSRLVVAAYWHNVNPGFCFSASVVQRIATLGLEVDFDLYCLGGPGDAG
jgi:hypothetical protein